MALQTNGGTDYYEDISSDFASFPLSFCARTRATSSLVGNQSLFSFANAVDGSHLSLRSSGNSIAQIRHANSVNGGNQVGTAQTMNAWGILAGRFVGSASRAIADSGGVTNSTGTVTGTFTPPDRLLIGCATDTSGAKALFTPVIFNHLIIWNTDLTDDEMLSITKYGCAPHLVRPANIIRMYNFLSLIDQVSGHTLVPFNSPTGIITGDSGRTKWPRKTKQNQY